MFGSYIYDVFEVTNKHELPDLYIGLAMLEHDQSVPEGTSDREIREFIGKHYKTLVDAYKTRNRTAFCEVVEECLKEDAEEAKEAEGEK